MELASGGTLANKIDQVKERLAWDTQRIPVVLRGCSQVRRGLVQG